MSAAPALAAAKAPTSTIWGYGIGSIMRVGENVFAFYLIYFLSTVAGVSPVVAGAIGGTGLLIGAIASPIFGHMSDRSRSRFGRRRPFMLALCIPAMALLTLLFTRVDLGPATAPFYVVVAIAFALTYYGYLVPYDSLGASLSSDYHQRTTIRSICTAFLYVSVLIGGTLIVQAQEGLAPIVGEAPSWSLAVLLCCALPGAIAALVAWRTTRGHEPAELMPTSTQSWHAQVRETLRIFKLRPVWAIIAWGVLYFLADAVLSGSLIYAGVYVLGLSEAVTSTYYLVATATTLAAIVPVNLLARKVGKRNAIFVGIALFATAAIIVGTVGLTSYAMGIVLVITYGFSNTIALTCGYAMIYDLREVTQLRIGRDSSAVVLGFFSLSLGLAGAFAAVLIGSVLQIAGFDADAAPSPGVITAITSLQTFIPVAILALSVVALLLWNVDEREHSAVTEELEVRAQQPTSESASAPHETPDRA